MTRHYIHRVREDQIRMNSNVIHFTELNPIVYLLCNEIKGGKITDENESRSLENVWSVRPIIVNKTGSYSKSHHSHDGASNSIIMSEYCL